MAGHGRTAVRGLFHLHCHRIVNELRLVIYFEVVAHSGQRVRTSVSEDRGPDLCQTLVRFSQKEEVQMYPNVRTS